MTKKNINPMQESALKLHPVEADVQVPVGEPVFFFNEGLRTRGQVVQGAQVNMAIANYLSSYAPTNPLLSLR